MSGIDFAISSSFATSSSYVEKIRSPLRDNGVLFEVLLKEIDYLCKRNITPATGTQLKKLIGKIDDFLSLEENKTIKKIKEAIESYRIVIAMPLLPGTSIPLAEDKTISKYAGDIRALVANGLADLQQQVCGPPYLRIPDI